jgi:hypothetical protein
MVDDAASTSDGKQAARAQRGLVDAARRVVGQVAARMPGLDGDIGQRNAWEAVCADLQRRQQWNDVVDLAVNAGRRPTRRRRAGTPPTRDASRPPRSSGKSQVQT